MIEITNFGDPIGSRSIECRDQCNSHYNCSGKCVPNSQEYNGRIDEFSDAYWDYNNA